MNRNYVVMLLLMTSLFLAACGEKTAVVESGTYTGTVKKVEADKREIYVTLDDGKLLELYFTENTELVRDSVNVNFTTLQQGQRVQVTVEKVGKRLDPERVRIME